MSPTLLAYGPVLRLLRERTGLTFPAQRLYAVVRVT